GMLPLMNFSTAYSIYSHWWRSGCIGHRPRQVRGRKQHGICGPAPNYARLVVASDGCDFHWLTRSVSVIVRLVRHNHTTEVYLSSVWVSERELLGVRSILRPVYFVIG